LQPCLLEDVAECRDETRPDGRLRVGRQDGSKRVMQAWQVTPAARSRRIAALLVNSVCEGMQREPTLDGEGRRQTAGRAVTASQVTGVAVAQAGLAGGGCT